MALYSLNLCIAYTWGVKKSVGRVVKTDVMKLSLRPPRSSDEARDNKGENDTQHREGKGESGTLDRIRDVLLTARPAVRSNGEQNAPVSKPPDSSLSGHLRQLFPNVAFGSAWAKAAPHLQVTHDRVAAHDTGRDAVLYHRQLVHIAAGH